MADGRHRGRPHGRTARNFSAAAARVAFPRDPARPQPTTAWRTLCRTLPARDTRADPHRVACTIGPSPLGTAAHARINHAVQGMPRTAAAQHERQNQLQQQRTTKPHALAGPPPRLAFPVPSHALCRPRSRSASTQSELRHALHTAHTRPPETSTAPAPPLPTRCTLPQHSTRAYGCD